MSSLFSWIKKQIGYFIDSIPELIKGFVLFVLAFSGLGIALLLRYFNQSGTIIISIGVIIEIFAMIVVYIIFKNYLKLEEEIKPAEKKQIKK